MPIIFACTGENTSAPKVAQKIAEAGFDKAFETPVTNAIVGDVIVPFIDARREALEEYLSFQQRYEDYQKSARSHQSSHMLLSLSNVNDLNNMDALEDNGSSALKRYLSIGSANRLWAVKVKVSKTIE